MARSRIVDVLVVEDDARSATLLGMLLEPFGYELNFVATLHEARAWLAEGLPDLVILDIGLPDGDGLELARELRAGGAAVPIVVTSANDLPEQRLAAAHAGCQAFSAKPLRAGQLLYAVAELIGQ